MGLQDGVKNNFCKIFFDNDNVNKVFMSKIPTTIFKGKGLQDLQ